jgi:hypothetical protein
MTDRIRQKTGRDAVRDADRPGSGPDAARAPGNRLRRAAKVGEPELVLIVRNFSLGLSVAGTAKRSGLSDKSVRAILLELRARLDAPRYNRWHHGGRRLLTIPDEAIEEAVRDAFFDTLAQCYFNATCYRNYRAGNRKTRLCRTCPLKTAVSGENLDDCLALADTVRAFYARLGIAAERGGDRVTLFRLRLLHTATVTAVLEHTRRRRGGMPDLTSDAYLSFRSLFETLLADLIDDPL